MKSEEIYTATKGFVAGTEILMADGTYKNIEYIKVGDLVLGIPEDPKDFKYPNGHHGHPYHCTENYIPTRVTSMRTYQDRTISVYYNYSSEHGEMFRVAKDQQFLTCSGEYMGIEAIVGNEKDYIYLTKDTDRPIYSSQIDYYELELHPGTIETIYSIETTTHTYVAGGASVHD